MEIQPKDTSRGHFYVSLAKSALRIVAGIFLIWPENIILAGAFLIAAEMLGILEVDFIMMELKQLLGADTFG